MKKFNLSLVTVLAISTFAIMVLNGCGSSSSDAGEAIEEATAVDFVDFSDLTDHRIVLEAVNNPDVHEIVFCQENTVRSGSYKNGTYDAEDDSKVEMTFDNAGQTLFDEDSDSAFDVDETVEFNGDDYLITEIHTAPFAVCD